MDNGYSRTDRQQTAPKQQQQQRQMTKPDGQTEESSALMQAMQHLQAGAGLRDLLPCELREVAAILGNQTLLNLLGGNGENTVPLAPETELEQDKASKLPFTAAEIRWPALTGPPFLARSGTLPDGVFPMEQWRTMGYTPERRAPDG